MTQIVGGYLLLLAIALAGWMGWQSIRGERDLISLRNIFLIGFILFQLVSGALPLLAGRFDMFRIADPGSTGLEYAAMASAFLFIFLAVYKWGIGVRRAAQRLGASAKRPPAGGFLLTMSAVFVALSAALRFGVAIPYVGILANIVGVGFASVAAGMVGWVWGRRLLNPAMLIWGGVVVLASAAVAMTGEFGRRNLVSVGGALVWGMYFANWRYLPPGRSMWRIGIVAVPPVLLIALFTSVRSSFGAGELGRQVSAMARGDVKKGLTALASGQGTGEAAMWVIEKYPESRPYDHMFSLKYFFLIPVPRAWWPEKPEPISTKLASYANIRGVNQEGITIPAGVVGNSAAEGGWYALIIYASVAGLFIRFFDEVVMANVAHPLIVLAVGSQLGQILGLPRGEPSNFANIYTLNFIGVWLTMIVIAKMLDAFGVKRELDVWHGVDDGYEDEALALDERSAEDQQAA